MTGDETENVPDQMADAAAPAPAPAEAATPQVELTAAEQAVADFDVPEPPSFDDAGGDLPVPDAVTSEPVIPPPPAFDEMTDASEPPPPQRSVAHRVAERAQSVQANARPVSYVELAPDPAAVSTEGGSYRGWTIAIFSGLAVLFFGAVGFMVFLGLGG